MYFRPKQFFLKKWREELSHWDNYIWHELDLIDNKYHYGNRTYFEDNKVV
jgi:hypothetical protein